MRWRGGKEPDHSSRSCSPSACVVSSAPSPSRPAGVTADGSGVVGSASANRGSGLSPLPDGVAATADATSGQLSVNGMTVQEHPRRIKEISVSSHMAVPTGGGNWAWQVVRLES